MTARGPSQQEWSQRIHKLMAGLQLTQSGLAERLGISPATVSRWLQGRHEPTAEGYLALGNLAQRPDAIYFWERAGMDMSGISGAGIANTSSVQVVAPELSVPPPERVTRRLQSQGPSVAVPLLDARVYGDEVPPPQNVSLSQAEVEEVFLVPHRWCNHPENLISMHVEGTSMMPAIPPEAIVFIDTASIDRDELDQRLAIASHRDLGFKLGRFHRMKGMDVLVPANPTCLPLDVRPVTQWKIFGEVLWWISKDLRRAS